MKYKAEIEVEGDSELLYKCFLTEAGEKDRSKLKISKKKEGVKLNIEAKDITALKASVHSALKLLEVHAKLKKIK